MIKYPQWIKKHCSRCDSKWLEVWKFVDSDGEYIGPVSVCPKCGFFKEYEENETTSSV